MVRKKIATAVLAFSAFQADMAMALGLGTVDVDSALNQPLQAKIRLLDVGDLDANQLRFQLATPEDFERAGVDRDYFLTNLRFRVDFDERGGAVVHVSTREPVVEPYLNFVVEARWPNGRLLREYAVLLDPPTFSGGAAPAVPATRSGLATVQQRSESRPAPSYSAPRGASPAPGVRQPRGTALPEAASGDRYRVQHADTLLDIATRHRPADDVDALQTMVAIQRANPTAFINDNINLVKSGYVLRMPTADEVRTIDAETAAASVAAQHRAWRGEADAAITSAPQIDARRRQPEEAGAAPRRERLSIASGGEVTDERPGEGSGDSGSGAAALREELTATRESLDRTRLENEELQSRLDDMERQVATLQRLLTLKDDQLAAMQSTAGVAASETSAPTAAGGSPAVGATPAADKPVAAPKPVRKADENGLLETLWGSPFLLPAAGAGLALLIAGVLLARRRQVEAEEPEPAAELETPESLLAVSTTEAAAEADQAGPMTATAEQEPADEAAAAVDGPDYEPAAAAVAAAPVRSETGDAIAEADIYIAYGRYQQAVDLLRSAIEQEPARTDLRVKLLEVYLEMRERSAFRQQFVELQSLGDEQAVAQVKELLSSVDGVSGWLDDLPAGTAAAVAASAWSPAGDAPAQSSYDAEQSADTESSLDDFDFDLDLTESDPAGERELGPNTFDQATLDQESLDQETLDQDGLDWAAADGTDMSGELVLDDSWQSAAGPVEESPLEESASATNTPDEDPLKEGQQFAEGSPVAEENPIGDTRGAEPAPDTAWVLGGGDGDSTPNDLDFDLDATPSEEPATPASGGREELLPEETGSSMASELDLDLGDDDLDLALSELEGDGGNDLLGEAFGAPGEIEVGGAAAEPAGRDGVIDGFSSEAGLELDLTDASAAAPMDAEATGEAEDDLTASDELALGLDVDDGFDIDFATQPSSEAVPPVVLVDEPSPVGAEPADFADIEGLGDLSDVEGPTELEELSSLDDLNTFGRAQGEQLDAAVDEAFQQFSELAEESDLTTGFDGGSEAELEDGAPDVMALEPFTAEAAAADADDEFDFLADADEIATKLDLARAYMDMGDTDGARDILGEIVQEGSAQQQEEAQGLLARIG